VHECWGNNAYARKRTDQLAKWGYAAFALDRYVAGKLADHPKDAQKYMEATLSGMKVAESRFNKAMKPPRQPRLFDLEERATELAGTGHLQVKSKLITNKCLRYTEDGGGI
jgi:dienelactone hydrolase